METTWFSDFTIKGNGGPFEVCTAAEIKFRKLVSMRSLIGFWM